MNIPEIEQFLKDKASNLPDLIDLMCNAMERHIAGRIPIKIAMQTFGCIGSVDEVCYGCVATCSLIYASKLDLTIAGPDEILEEVNYYNYANGYPQNNRPRSEIVIRFEKAIDRIRGGLINPYQIVLYYESIGKRIVEWRFNEALDKATKSFPLMAIVNPGRGSLDNNEIEFGRDAVYMYRNFAAHLRSIGFPY